MDTAHHRIHQHTHQEEIYTYTYTTIKPLSVIRPGVFHLATDDKNHTAYHHGSKDNGCQTQNTDIVGKKLTQQFHLPLLSWRFAALID